MNMINRFNQFLTPLFDSIDCHFQDFQPLTKVAELVRLRPAHVILPIFILALIALGTGFFSNLFVAIFGMVYPAYMTFKALTRNHPEECKQWLTYWIVFGMFTALSGVMKYAFFFLSLRSYNVFRILFYIFLFHPATKGAALIYHKILRKSLIEGTETVEERMKQL